MTYTSEIEINLPVERVVELFDNVDNLYQWMTGLKSYEHLSGEPGQPGAKSLMKMHVGGREMTMTETILVRNLPQEFSGTYEMPGVYNKIVNRFIPIAESKTRYVTEQEFRFSGAMKLLGALMPGSFKSQSMKYLENFKQFAESKGV